jgi:hypothetical protein
MSFKRGKMPLGSGHRNHVAGGGRGKNSRLSVSARSAGIKFLQGQKYPVIGISVWIPSTNVGRFSIPGIQRIGDITVPVITDKNEIENSEVKCPENLSIKDINSYRRPVIGNFLSGRGWRKRLVGSCLNECSKTLYSSSLAFSRIA